jgi:hypothetical protein
MISAKSSRKIRPLAKKSVFNKQTKIVPGELVYENMQQCEG